MIINHEGHSKSGVEELTLTRASRSYSFKKGLQWQSTSRSKINDTQSDRPQDIMRSRLLASLGGALRYGR